MAAHVTPPMSSTDLSAARYLVIDPAGNSVHMSEVHTRTRFGVPIVYLEIRRGGNTITLSQTNAADLATGMTNFGTNGVLS